MLKNATKPILVLDEERCKRNIQRMAAKTNHNGIKFRPHFKTHQSLEVGHWVREQGITGITVSSPEMALYFALDGWTDITIGFPFYPAQLESLIALEDHCELRLFVNNPEHLKLLNNNLKSPFKFYIEIDPGYGRSGIHYQQTDHISSLIRTSHQLNKCEFHGFYIHDGRTYKVNTKQQVSDIFHVDLEILKNLKTIFPEAVISMGDTPSAGYLNEISELDEMTAGNFVFFDWMQTRIGSSTLDDVAVYAILPIAQHISSENRLIVHGGAVHLSKDYLETDGRKNFGQIIDMSSGGTVKVIEGLFIHSLSQEHGIIEYPDELKEYVIDKNQLWVCPIHSCLTANLFETYVNLKGETILKRILS